MNRVKSLVLTYGGAIVFTWLGYLLHWLDFLAAVGISLVFLGLFGVASWLVMWVGK